jgi:hypothetical protein
MTQRAFSNARAALLLALLLCASALSAHAQIAPAADLAARLNRERVARGLAPLALNAQLTAAAQAHAEDVARNGQTSSPQAGHIGSDGSNVFERVARTGYGAYSWGRRLGENWAWYRNTADAFAMWMESAPHRANILHPLFREMGIGVAAVGNGTFIYVIDFGAQPNVLPIFINDGATETLSREVKLTLTNEEVTPNGDGDNIGRPVQVMVSNTADFAGAAWQAYAPKISWTLAPNGGMKTVYVKYRDAKGRTALARASIVLGAAATSTSAPSRAPATLVPTRATALPTLTPTRTPTETPTETPTAPATPTEISTIAVEMVALPTLTPTPETSPARLDDLGLVVVAVMSLVMIRAWYAVEH